MRWRPLFAVLLGLLMVGVTAGSASAQVFPTNIQTSNVRSYPKTISPPATNLYQFHPLPLKPEVFLDKDQVELGFSKYDSYVQYGGRIYLAFYWILDTLGVPNAGSPDRVSLLIPWGVKTPSGWVQIFEEDNPNVYVKVYVGDNSTIKIIGGFPLIEKKIKDKKTGKTLDILFKRVQISVPENDVTSAEIYVGMTPRPEFVNTTLSIVMAYTHTWSWALFTSVILGTVISAPFYFIPSTSFMGYLVANAVISFTAYELQGLLPDESWTIAKIFNVKLDYSEYPLRGGPSPAPCFNGRCATYINPENRTS